MTPEEYELEHDRTFLVNGAVPPKAPHALGLCGEIGELIEAIEYDDKEAVSKEAGDVLWYITATAKTNGITLDVLHEYIWDIPVGETTLHLFAARYADSVKKETWHDLPMDRARTIDQLGYCLGALYAVCANRDLDLWNEVAPANIEKLKARYPRGFEKGKGEDR